ncbi:lasso peptide isopeptide bond-forming cyclase [Methanobacterium petrolearium]|uniref:lasso peptide isopeptide bond-forming cyclase n=1 Tax=Methanobacterium petrolearium TaxID=710190 RepID=UPI001AE4BE50|nr:lasso peptide isopeptide bond-forming cyclase [Methanobacterium petrolearium]MBP1944675.1 asparagine synthase (glutamine-hydrolyzing) [Methanobacterium petrolearium]BDZ69939.1 asparagine synthetase B [Methanobacterium petrolearium]
MSAITGIFYRNNQEINPKLIQKINDRLSHRGPDGSAVWCEGSVALGHQMLHTTPESLHEKLPFYDEKPGLVITADARIDNRRELAKELDIEDNEYVSDSYFILKSYEKWGEICPEYLLGDFAFAIWDENKERLFCARDHMGVKPFYYYLDDEMFVFGTEIKAILTIPNITCELDKNKLANYLMIVDFFNKENTFYENIKRLPNAFSIILDENFIEKRSYWRLNPKSEIIMDSKEDYAQKFREIFTEAVKCRLRSYSIPGVMLSGGLDSSSVASIAQKICYEGGGTKKIHSFSYVFDDHPDIDERIYINKVLERGKVKSHFIKCDDIDPLERINEKIKFGDQPINTYQTGVIHRSRQKMYEQGVCVLLTGEGGDQILSHGNNYLDELLVTFKWKKFMQNINYIADVQELSRFKLFLNIVYRTLTYYLFQISFFYSFFKKNHNILNKKFLKTAHMRNLDDVVKFRVPHAKKVHYYHIELGQHQLSFEILDQESSAYHIDTRHPFYDKRLVEFCFAIPTEMKVRFGWSRYVCRLAMDEILPEEIQWRSTKSIVGNVSANKFLSNQEMFEKVINDREKVIKKYVNIEKLHEIYTKKSSKNVNLLWRVLLFYLWQLKKNKL